jgi:rare lipoprotein A
VRIIKNQLFALSFKVFQLIALYSLLIAFLTSCSSVHTKASPTPLYEKKYTFASWYGPKFHGRPTSSGEIFNMYAMTCAHKEYPFGTRLKVTNIENNRSAECIVNDRGPFVEGRDIDLSYAVAKEIGVIGSGIARVLIEVNGRDNSYIRRVKVQTSEKTGLFAVQVGSFSESINAIQLRAALRLKYANVYVQETEVKGMTYYRVRVGNYKDYNAALSVAEQLGQAGYPVLLLKADLNI